MVNYIKSRPLESRLFTKLCKEAKANYENRLLHTEARWFSRGKVLSRVYEVFSKSIRLFCIKHSEFRKFCLISFKVFPLAVHTLFPVLLPLLKTSHKFLLRNAPNLLRRFFYNVFS